MRATVLIDNLAQERLACEWGLSVHIAYKGKNILLDAGTTGSFADNAKELGIDLAAVDLAVLSHAHYDHANGLDRFFRLNSIAPVYIAEEARENCYSWKKFLPRYNGLRRGMLRDHAARFIRSSGEILPGAHLLPHGAPFFPEMGRTNALYVRRGLRMLPDDFRHEHSLVLETPSGLAVFSSCSHAGPDVVIREVQSAFPGQKIRAIIGGFHLYRTPEPEIRALACRIRSLGVESIITGHCTGSAAFEILRGELGLSVQQMYTGMIINL
ncbi:MAG: MBL fold metallo-hydrolase [Clostridia bacterium]|nr:MBL fold metallo-hydrolase [Clostridia bacterium]